MYALVANGICAVCKTQAQLETLIAIYPYPKFTKVYSEAEGRDWIRRHTRKRNEYAYEEYGTTFRFGMVKVSYCIKEDCVEYYIDTSKCGYVRVQEDRDTAIEIGNSHMRVIVQDFHLDDNVIIHHVLAIRRILRILGSIVDVELVIPDISIYLALMKYTGNNYVIKGAQREIDKRIGGFSVTIKDREEKETNAVDKM